MDKIQRIHFDSIHSTNTWAKQHASELHPEAITCITASEQTAGRGRFERRWISPRGVNLYATLFFCLRERWSWVQNIGQVLALSVVRALEQKVGSIGYSILIKWPNDLLVHGKKIAGILSETVPLPERTGIVLGLGLNVNMPKDLLEQIDQPATSLLEISGSSWSTEQVLEGILDTFQGDLDQLVKEGFAGIAEEFNRHLAYLHEQVVYHNEQTSFEAICNGVDAEGYLLLQKEGEEGLVRVHSGSIQKKTDRYTIYQK